MSVGNTYRNDGEISVRDFLIALVTSLVSLQSTEHHKYDQSNDNYSNDNGMKIYVYNSQKKR